LAAGGVSMKVKSDPSRSGSAGVRDPTKSSCPGDSQSQTLNNLSGRGT
jgi:hypothetical protein